MRNRFANERLGKISNADADADAMPMTMMMLMMANKSQLSWESWPDSQKLKTCQSECHGKLAKIIANQMEDMTSHKETFQPTSNVRD